MTEEAYCVEGCGNVATYERLDSLTSDGTEIVELVCHAHRDAI